MKTITQYREDIAALMKKAGDIDARCIQDGRDLNPEERSMKDQILDRVEELQNIVKLMERQEKVSASLEKPQERMTVPSDVKMEGEKKGRDRDKFTTLGEQLASIIKAGSPNGYVDPRLYNAASGMNETVPSEGGFLIQTDFATRLYEDLFDNSLIAGQCETIPISGNSNGIVINGFDETSRASSIAGGIIVYHADEAELKTASKPKFRRVELSLKKTIGACYLTDELMMDAPAMESRVSSAFRSAFDFQVQDDIINGTGAGMALGVMNAGCLVSVSAEAGQAADSIVAENIVNMYSRRFASQTGNYAWYYNQDIEPQLFTMSLAVGTGGIPVYLPPGGLSGKPYAQIMGLPAYAIEQCPTLGDSGDLILANFKDGYIMATKGGLRQDMSIHVRFMYDEGVLRWVLRMDGQPWRASALTPYKSSNTQSHFIVMEAR